MTSAVSQTLCSCSVRFGRVRQFFSRTWFGSGFGNIIASSVKATVVGTGRAGRPGPTSTKDFCPLLLKNSASDQQEIHIKKNALYVIICEEKYYLHSYFRLESFFILILKESCFQFVNK